LGARVHPIEQCRARAADMKISRRAWGKSHLDHFEFLNRLRLKLNIFYFSAQPAEDFEAEQILKDLRIFGVEGLCFPDKPADNFFQTLLVFPRDIDKFNSYIEKQRLVFGPALSLDIPDDFAFAAYMVFQIKQVQLELNGAEHFYIMLENDTDPADSDIVRVR